MLANGFMTARGVVQFSNPKKEIVAYFAHMARFPAHLFRKARLAVPSRGRRGIKLDPVHRKIIIRGGGFLFGYLLHL
jgi:hypothetical protein